MKGYKKYATIILLAVLLFCNFAVSAEVTAASKPKYRPFLREKSLSLTEGESKKLTIKYADEYKIEYKIADKSIAKLSQNGKITAVKMGQTEIYISFSFAGKVKYDRTIPITVWKEPFSELTETRTVEPGMQCQIWVASTSKGDTDTKITISTESEDEKLSLHVFRWESNPRACPSSKEPSSIAVDKGYINNKTKQKSTSGKLFLKSPVKTVWFNNDTGAPVEVEITVAAADGKEVLKYVEIKDVPID